MEIAPPESPAQEHVSQVPAPDSKSPTPRGRYHLIVVGGGTAGIAAATGAVALGARVALVEKNLLGGDRLHCGSVPLVALLRSAQAAYDATRGDEFGFSLPKPPHVDFAEVMDRMRCLQADLNLQHSAARLTSLGVDVYPGSARFTGRNSLEVEGQTLEFSRAVVCTGGQAKAPSLAGLEEIGYRTSETIFSLQELPKRLVVLGAGSFGCEIAQAFRRFGSEVHLVSRSTGILSKDEPAAARLVQEQFEREGIRLHLGWTAMTAEKTGDSKSLILERRGEKKKIIADEIVVAAARRPNVDGLELEVAGVDATPQGIVVNDRLRTTNPKIFAAGDATGKSQFAAAADAMAQVCLQNSLFFGWRRLSSLVVPRCTFTDPEVAQVGLTSAEAQRQGILLDTYQSEMKDVDRAVLDGETQGFVQVHCRRGTGRIVGATIVARRAGEMIGEITLLMTKRLSLRSLAVTNHCYPTQTAALERIADSYSRHQRTPFVMRALQRYFSWWPTRTK
jgi:pyruvate/2-oxoglutarate dehydrogenase complex dihydrolipoamide dehydrogenase (E3) component